MGDFFALSDTARASAVERVGRVGTLIQEAIEHAADALNPLRDMLSAALLGVSTKKQAKQAIRNALAPYQGSAAIANALFVPGALADLAGQLMVHAYEAPHGKERRQLALGEGQDPRAFLSMGWEEALNYFKDRGLVTPRELERLLKRRARESEDARDLLLKRTQERVYELLGEAVSEGTSYREFAVALREEADGLGITLEDPAYLQTVFRTNVMDAYGQGRARAMQNPAVVAARPYRQIRTANDGRVREEHENADLAVFMADGPLGDLRTPFGFNCFPGHVEVQGTFNTAYRALYDGEIVEITTQHGRRLTVTPNHPVATVDGFAAAGLLREGDQLICHVGRADSCPPASPKRSAVDEHHAPAVIEQVFRSFATAVGGFTAHGRPEDFDGDALFFQSHVDVVGSARELVRGREASGLQQVADARFFRPSPPREPNVRGSRHGGELRAGADASGGGFPGGSALANDSGPVAFELRPLQQLSFGPAANVRVSRYQHPADGGSADAAFIRQLLLAHPGQVAPDKIVGIRRLPWRDHVYDLQSPYGWIAAEGIITTNCRCSIVSLATWGGEVIETVPDGLLTPGFGGM